MEKITAINLMLYLLVVVILFHLCIMLKIVPYEISWGGRLKNDTEMYVFETISIIINLLLFSILLIKGKYLGRFISMKIVNAALWVFLVVFGLNTIGNILAKTYFEKFFALLTLFFSILIWIILRKDKKRKHNIV
ncbi:hypothetical protein GCM10023311_07950 [Flaviramulus aquimarinus]|uniref:Uncharacterized protein n=1 Tax=Flaviramulus aquimarinus TaxID=1170456 RepID=A0ABP9EW03_9FLAO